MLQERNKCPSYITIPTNSFLPTYLKRDKQKMDIFSNRSFGWCEDSVVVVVVVVVLG
jgi:hypothetical protein